MIRLSLRSHSRTAVMLWFRERVSPFLWVFRLSLSLVISAALTVRSDGGDAMKRLSVARLSAVREAVQTFAEQRKTRVRSGPYREFRANLHVHSHWSHDSQGRIEEIVTAAQRVGTSVLMFTEHPAESYDFFHDGHQGMRDGVLLIPGAEMQGFLVFPRISLRGVTTSTPQELSELVQGRGGQSFVSHPEERMDWTIQGVTGIEIYNTHADFKDEPELVAAMKNPLKLFQLAGVIRDYPQEAFAAIQDYPVEYLKKFDELCQQAPHCGISANDSHQNIGLGIRWIEDDRGQLEDASGKRLLEINVGVLPDHEALRQNHRPGDLLFEFCLDRYENSLRHVGTHLLMTDLTEYSVRECLDAGRAFVAFDWIADSTGFEFFLDDDGRQYEAGSDVLWTNAQEFVAHAPLPVHWRVLCGGQTVFESDGEQFRWHPESPGVYRTEAWLNVAGEQMIWILTNPIYLR